MGHMAWQGGDSGGSLGLQVADCKYQVMAQWLPGEMQEEVSRTWELRCFLELELIMYGNFRMAGRYRNHVAIRLCFVLAFCLAGTPVYHLDEKWGTSKISRIINILLVPLSFVSSSAIMQKKYNDKYNVAMPSIGGPVFQGRLPLQDEYDSVIITSSVAVGGLLGAAVHQSTISFISLAGIAWAAGEWLAILFTIHFKRDKQRKIVPKTTAGSS
jgi:hypothetical protein